MGRKSSISFEAKLAAVKSYLAGNHSVARLALELGVGTSTIIRWLNSYRAQGENGLKPAIKNNRYSKEFKLKLVELYLLGKGSYRELAFKYGLRNESQLVNWVSKYNSHIELEDYIPHPEVHMTSRRKATPEEKKQVVIYFLDHKRNYAETAAHFGYSYGQVYSWVKKYLTGGSDALLDRRGKHKQDEELTDLERAERKIKNLEERLEASEKENILLKKLQDLERMMMLEDQKHK